MGQGPTIDAAGPAAFNIRKVTLWQNAYPSHHQEALAIIEAIASFEYLLRDRHFTLVTDNATLTKMMTQKSLSGWQQRWPIFLSQFYFPIEYQPGEENFLADYLLRIHDRIPNCKHMMQADPTSQGSKTDTLPNTLVLFIDTHLFAWPLHWFRRSHVLH